MDFLKTEKAPEGFRCPDCDKETLEVTKMLLTGPYSGSVKCTNCGFSDSVCNYLAKKIIKVTPLEDEEETNHD
jgi:transcription elongation factor Elf1